MGTDFGGHWAGIAFGESEVMAMTAFRRMVAKVRGLFFIPEKNADFETEIEDHLNMLVDRYIQQGMTSEDAHQAARRQLGNITAVREQRRGMQQVARIDAFGRALRYAAVSVGRVFA